MRTYKKEQQQLPMLLFLLQHKKYSELIKSLLNQNLARKLLIEYGVDKPQPTKYQVFKMNQDIRHFTVQDLIEIKGSTNEKVRRYQNTYLVETILRKLKEGYCMQQNQRKALWLQFTEIYSMPNLYENLDALELPPDTQSTLDKDIKRTYFSLQTKNQQQKQIQTNKLRLSIKQSLSRFALYNPFLLYCQGMNEVFAFFCEEQCSPKQIFFIFKRISEVLLPSDYYSSLDGIVAYLKILWEMITVLYPKIHQKLLSLVKEMNINGNYICVFSHVLQWFVCLFTNSNLNRNIRRTVVDHFMLQGITAFFKASLAIYEYLQKIILSATSFQSYIIKFDEGLKLYDDVENLRKALSSKYMSKQILFLLKEYSSIPKQKPQRKFMPYTKKCSRKWNFCLQQLQNNIYEHFKYDFFVFKTKQPLNIIPEYLHRLHNYYFQKKRNLKPIELTRIGRISHVCDHGSQTCTEDSLSEDNTKKESPYLSRYSPSPMRAIQIQVKQPIKDLQNNINESIPSLRQFTTDNQQNNCNYQNDMMSSSMLAVNDDSSVFHRKQTLEYRQLIKKRLLVETQKKTMQKSESMMFMKLMVDNESYSNLFSLLENQEMDKMFAINSDSDQEESPTSYNSADKVQGYSPSYFSSQDNPSKLSRDMTLSFEAGQTKLKVQPIKSAQYLNNQMMLKKNKK